MQLDGVQSMRGFAPPKLFHRKVENHLSGQCVNQDLGSIIGVSRPSHQHLMIDHFVPTTRTKASTISKAMEIHIRKAGVEDLKHILHHRRAMFEEMGFRDTPVLDRVED